jgi:HSP20 family protein
MAVWDPFRELSRIEREIRKMFDEFWGERRRWGLLPALRRVELPAEREEGLIGTPAVDLIDKGDTLVLRSEMPGVKKQDIKISVGEDNISISGKVERKKEEKEEDYYCCERTYSAWQRTIPLPLKVKSEQAKATYQNGVLEITLPKVEEARAKKKEIKVE